MNWPLEDESSHPSESLLLLPQDMENAVLFRPVQQIYCRNPSTQPWRARSMASALVSPGNGQG